MRKTFLALPNLVSLFNYFVDFSRKLRLNICWIIVWNEWIDFRILIWIETENREVEIEAHFFIKTVKRGLLPWRTSLKVSQLGTCRSNHLSLWGKICSNTVCKYMNKLSRDKTSDVEFHKINVSFSN